MHTNFSKKKIPPNKRTQYQKKPTPHITQYDVDSELFYCRDLHNFFSISSSVRIASFLIQRSRNDFVFALFAVSPPPGPRTTSDFGFSPLAHYLCYVIT